MLDFILASNPSLTPVPSFPAQYEPLAQILPLSSSMPSLSALCMYIDSFQASCLLSCVQSCLLTIWLRTVYIQRLHIHVSWRAYSVPPTFRSCTVFLIEHIIRSGLMYIWAPSHSFLHSLVSLLDMNSSVYFSTLDISGEYIGMRSVY